MKTTMVSMSGWARAAAREGARGLRIAAAAGFGLAGAAGGDEHLVDLSRYESAQRRPGQDAGTAVVLALSGGGHRAAGFHAGAMLGLDELAGARVAGSGAGGSALAEVDYIVTISSGGCPVAGYLAGLRRHLDAGRRPGAFPFLGALTGDGRDERPSLAERLRGDQFSVLFGRGLLPELLPGGRNRGDILQRYLDAEICDGLSLGDIFVPRGAGRAPRLPYWIMCSTVDANGQIFCHTPDTYERYGIEAVRSGGAYRAVGRGAGDVPCALALKSSMAFPIFIPPTVMRSGHDPDRPYVQLRDGGIADNLGIHTGLDLLRQEKRVNRRVMIVIDANCADTEPWQESTRRGGLVHHINDLCGLPLDARLHRYREILTSGGRRHGAAGRLVGGRTYDGIEVHFVGPEVLAAETMASVKEIGTTLKLEPSEQELLLHAGRAAVRRVVGGDESTGTGEPSVISLTVAAPGRTDGTAHRQARPAKLLEVLGGTSATSSPSVAEIRSVPGRWGAPHRRAPRPQAGVGTPGTLSDFLRERAKGTGNR